MSWRLKRTAQCRKCPWLKSVDPRDIPNGYDVAKHLALASTIAVPGDVSLVSRPLRVMACHEEHEAHCIGWIHNQANAGNNIPLRLALSTCANAGAIKLRGEQHETFAATLPRGAP